MYRNKYLIKYVARNDSFFEKKEYEETICHNSRQEALAYMQTTYRFDSLIDIAELEVDALEKEISPLPLDYGKVESASIHA